MAAEAGAKAEAPPISVLARFSIGDGFQPIVSADMPAGTSIYAERGAILASSDTIAMTPLTLQNTGLEGATKFLARMLTGEGAVLMEYKNAGEAGGELHLNSGTQSIVSVAVTPDEGWIVQRGSYFAANSKVAMDPAFVRDLSFMVLGGQGMFLQSITADRPAEVLLESPGHVLERTLGDGEVLRIQPSSLMGITTGVSLALAENRGLMKRFKSGEERFFVAVRGPGTVLLRTEKTAAEKGWIDKLLPG